MKNLLRLEVDIYSDVEVASAIYTIEPDFPFSVIDKSTVRIGNWDIVLNEQKINHIIKSKLYVSDGDGYYPSDKLKFLLGG